MKKGVCFLITLFWLSLFILGITSHTYAGVVDGLLLLFNEGAPTHAGLLQANQEFLSAVQDTPSDPVANFFYAVTRIAALLNENDTYIQSLPFENIKELLDSFGISASGRDIYEWTADFPKDAQGNIELPVDTPAPS